MPLRALPASPGRSSKTPAHGPRIRADRLLSGDSRWSKSLRHRMSTTRQTRNLNNGSGRSRALPIAFTQSLRRRPTFVYRTSDPQVLSRCPASCWRCERALDAVRVGPRRPRLADWNRTDRLVSHGGHHCLNAWSRMRRDRDAASARRCSRRSRHFSALRVPAGCSALSARTSSSDSASRVSAWAATKSR